MCFVEKDYVFSGYIEKLLGLFPVSQNKMCCILIDLKLS